MYNPFAEQNLYYYGLPGVDLVEELKSIVVLEARKLRARGTVLLTIGKPNYREDLS